jgi:hypothetical protein
LWYGAIAVTLLAWRQLLSPALAPVSAIVATAAVFLFVLVGFPGARAWLADQTTVNRATLHVAALVVVFAALAFREFALNWTRTQAVPVAPGS